jgi:AP endonuclease-2
VCHFLFTFFVLSQIPIIVKGWNTKLSARETNYGTRIDYILGTRGLLPWLKHGDIQALVKGSDHCPIYVDLHDEIVLPSGVTLTLREAMKMDDTKKNSPRLASKHWDEFSGKQTLLSTFFGKRESVPSIPTVVSPPPVKSPLEESSTSSATPPSPPRENNPTPPQATTAKRKLDIPVPPQTKSKKQKPGQAKLSTFFIPKPDPPKSTSPTDDIPKTDPGVIPDLGLSQSQSASSSSSSQTKAAWSHLLAPIQPPKCTVHGEPTKEFTVNKPGPNKGKNFFICSR